MKTMRNGKMVMARCIRPKEMLGNQWRRISIILASKRRLQSPRPEPPNVQVAIIEVSCWVLSLIHI